MPWVVACFDLVATPLLGYCLAVRKLALQYGILQEKKIDLVGRSTSNTGTSSLTLTQYADATTDMVPNAEEQRQGKALRDIISSCSISRGMLMSAYVISISSVFYVIAFVGSLLHCTCCIKTSLSIIQL